MTTFRDILGEVLEAKFPDVKKSAGPLGVYPVVNGWQLITARIGRSVRIRLEKTGSGGRAFRLCFDDGYYTVDQECGVPVCTDTFNAYDSRDLGKLDQWLSSVGAPTIEAIEEATGTAPTGLR